MSGRNQFKKYEKFIYIIAAIIQKFPYKIRIFLWNFHNKGSGKYSLVMRFCILKSLIKNCGSNVFIGKNVVIKNFQNISLGNNVSIHEFCYIDGLGGIEIGDNVSIAHASSIISFNHDWENASIPIKYNKLKSDKIIISDDVWIACGVRVLSGARISNRSIVAANSVVTKGSYENNSILGGVPVINLKNINN